MPDRPSSAFALSLFGGIITLISALLSIGSWFSMYANSGTTFTYNLLGDLLGFTAVEALGLFILGGLCGTLIIAGAFMQRSGQKSKVRSGSIMLLVAAVVAAPWTGFGLLIGGILSICGGYLGLTWKTGKKSTLSPDQFPNVLP